MNVEVLFGWWASTARPYGQHCADGFIVGAHSVRPAEEKPYVNY